MPPQQVTVHPILSLQNKALVTNSTWQWRPTKVKPFMNFVSNTLTQFQLITNRSYTPKHQNRHQNLQNAMLEINFFFLIWIRWILQWHAYQAANKERIRKGRLMLGTGGWLMTKDQTFQRNQRQEAFHHCLECKIEGQSHQCSTSKHEEPQKLCECMLFCS